MKTDRRTRTEAERARRRQEQAQKRAQSAAAAARTAEDRDEAITPSAQRKPVTAVLPGDTEPSVIRAPRARRDGVTFVASNPIAHLVARSGDNPTITERHKKACERLVNAWNEGGRSVGLGASDWGRQGGHGGTVPQGIAESVLTAIGAQNRAKAVFEGAMAWLGGLGRVVRRVVLDGADVTVYAAEAKLNRQVALGYLAAALDRLTEFFDAVDEAKRQPALQAKIRAAEIVLAEAK